MERSTTLTAAGPEEEAEAASLAVALAADREEALEAESVEAQEAALAEALAAEVAVESEAESVEEQEAAPAEA